MQALHDPFELFVNIASMVKCFENLGQLVIQIYLLNVLSNNGIERVAQLMGDAGIDEGEEGGLGVLLHVHDACGHVDDLNDLAVSSNLVEASDLDLHISSTHFPSLSFLGGCHLEDHV